MTESDDQPEPDTDATADAKPKRSRKGVGGPKTAEGKARSARNALKHGLRARSHVPDELLDEAIHRAEQFAADLRPVSAYQGWLVRLAGIAAAKLDRAAILETEHLRERIEAAKTCWDADRRHATEELAAKLPKDPPRIAAALRVRRHGLEWLIARWEQLGNVLERRGAWDDDQRRLALDLLGTPPALRDGSAEVRDDASTAELSRVVDRQLRVLRGELEKRVDLDAQERRLACRGVFLTSDATTRYLQRLTADQHRALRVALQEFRHAIALPFVRRADAPAPTGEASPDRPGNGAGVAVPTPARPVARSEPRGASPVPSPSPARAGRGERAARGGEASRAPNGLGGSHPTGGGLFELPPRPEGRREIFPGVFLPDAPPWYELARKCDAMEEQARQERAARVARRRAEKANTPPPDPDR